MLEEQKCVLSYSGGKDSTLALFHMLQTAEPVALIAMLEEQGQRSRSHGMDTALIAAQAQALGLPIITAAASWQDYEAKFAEVLKSCQRFHRCCSLKTLKTDKKAACNIYRPL